MRNFLNAFLAVFISISFLLVCGSVSAEPVAPLSKYSKDGMKLIKQQNKSLEDLKKDIPSKEKVGIPIYPGATFASAIEGSEGGLPPSVNLISNDPPEKVRKWYENNLEGWNYSEKLDLFYEGQKEPEISELFEGKYQTVSVMKEEGEGIDLMFLDVPDVKTRIQIVYKPKK